VMEVGRGEEGGLIEVLVPATVMIEGKDTKTKGDNNGENHLAAVAMMTGAEEEWKKRGKERGPVTVAMRTKGIKRRIRYAGKGLLTG